MLPLGRHQRLCELQDLGHDPAALEIRFDHESMYVDGVLPVLRIVGPEHLVKGVLVVEGKDGGDGRGGVVDDNIRGLVLDRGADVGAGFVLAEGARDPLAQIVGLHPGGGPLEDFDILVEFFGEGLNMRVFLFRKEGFARGQKNDQRDSFFPMRHVEMHNQKKKTCNFAYISDEEFVGAHCWE